MASPHDYARLLILKASADFTAFQVLLSNDNVADEIIGFHAQQVIEKSLKAVLSLNSIIYRKTHDLTELTDLLSDNGIEFPLSLENAIELTPFAVEFRYDFLPPETGNVSRMERPELREIVSSILEWARLTIIGEK